MTKAKLILSGFAASLLFAPAAFAQYAGGGGGAGGVPLPSQRIVNQRSAGIGATMTPSRPQVRRVQQLLDRLGYSAGPINGIFDRPTSRALAEFQAAHGLAPVGRLDRTTIALLDRDSRGAASGGYGINPLGSSRGYSGGPGGGAGEVGAGRMGGDGGAAGGGYGGGSASGTGAR